MPWSQFRARVSGHLVIALLVGLLFQPLAWAAPPPELDGTSWSSADCYGISYVAHVADELLQFSGTKHFADDQDHSRTMTQSFVASTISIDRAAENAMSGKVVSGSDYKRGTRVNITLTPDWKRMRIDNVTTGESILFVMCSAPQGWTAPAARRQQEAQDAAQNAARDALAARELPQLLGDWSYTSHSRDDADEDGCRVVTDVTEAMHFNPSNESRELNVTYDETEELYYSGVDQSCRFEDTNTRHNRERSRYSGILWMLDSNGTIVHFKGKLQLVSCEGDCGSNSNGSNWAPTLTLSEQGLQLGRHVFTR